MMIKKLLKKHRYPPEEMDDAVQTVMTQCELWTDNNDMEQRVTAYDQRLHQYVSETYDIPEEKLMVAEGKTEYGMKQE